MFANAFGPFLNNASVVALSAINKCIGNQMYVSNVGFVPKDTFRELQASEWK